MGKNKGWVSLHRSILDHFLWKDKPFSKGQAWIDLILLANHEDTKILQGGQIKQFKRGTVNMSLLSLADRWGWDRKKVRKFFEVLECDGMATTERTTQGTTITLVNYEVYNILRTTEGTTEGQRLPQRLPTNNNGNNEDHGDKKDIARHKHGEYQNVLLSDEELSKLKEEFTEAVVLRKLDELSEYMESTGKSYKSHYATLRVWLKKDQEKEGEAHEEHSDIDKGKTFSLSDF